METRLCRLTELCRPRRLLLSPSENTCLKDRLLGDKKNMEMKPGEAPSEKTLLRSGRDQEEILKDILHAVRAATAILFFILCKNHKKKKKKKEDGGVIYAIIEKISDNCPEKMKIRLERNWVREAHSGTCTCLLHYTLVLIFSATNPT